MFWIPILYRQTRLFPLAPQEFILQLHLNFDQLDRTQYESIKETSYDGRYDQQIVRKLILTGHSEHLNLDLAQDGEL